jgi:lysophospholipase L1-like esterase
MKKVIILFALMLTGCVEAKEEIVCNPTIEYIEVIKYVEVDNIIIETEYIEVLVKVPYETIKEVIVEVPVEVIVYETITKTKWRTEYINVEVEIEVPIYVDYVENIVFVGDSITNNFYIPIQDETTRYFNMGVNGKRTSYVLETINDIMALQPDKIFLMIGINDIKGGETYETIIDNYDDIIFEMITTAPNLELYVYSVLPVSESVLTSGIIPIVNAHIEQRADLYKQVHYIDLHSLFVDDNGYLQEELTKDGVHLRGIGYDVWRDYLIESGFLINKRAD